MAKFSDLPQELRDIIWEQAVRPERPGVHVFTVHDADEDTHLVGSPWSVKRSTDISNDGIPGSSLLPPKFDPISVLEFAAPRCRPDGNLSWTQRNPSTYMEDSALWTTCRDSRRYMIRRFRPAETSRRIVREQTSQTHRQLSASGAATVTAALQRESGERQYFTIQPMKDLIIIQDSPSSCMSWDRDIRYKISGPAAPVDDRWWFLSRNAFLTWRVPRCVVCAPRNVAFEFDVKWCDQIKKYRTVFLGVLMMERVETIWFVDYRLQRNPQKSLSAEESQRLQANRQVFYAQDRRFVEVSPVDSEWIVRDEAGEECYGGQVFEFITWLGYRRFFGYHVEDDEGNSIPDPVLKVLGCELL
ncbi:hypothetical protein LA080_006642 [Diaporthe eres]|nr:hypothetical protein LA080_006642 [Diaporthe eres]